VFVCVYVCIYIRLFAEVTCKMRHIRGLCNPVRDRCEGNLCVGVLCLYVYLYVRLFSCTCVCLFACMSAGR